MGRVALALCVLILALISVPLLAYSKFANFLVSRTSGRPTKWGAIASGMIMGIMFGAVPAFIAYELTDRIWIAEASDFVCALACGYGWHKLDSLQQQNEK